jgi:hypothetical protein
MEFSNNGGTFILDFILRAIEHHFKLWESEAGIIDQITSVLDSLAMKKDSCDGMLSNAIFGQLVQYILSNMGRLPADSHKPLIKSISKIATNASDSAMKDNCLKTVSNAIESALNSIISQPNFLSEFQSTIVREQLVVVLELFDGLALAIDETTTIPIFEACGRHFETFVKLLDLYHSYPDVVLYILKIVGDLIQFQVIIY